MNTMTINELFENIDDLIIIDLRSEKEYNDGTIKGAVNVPLLDNEARHMIGALYKSNRDEAYKEGLKIGSLRLPLIHEKVLQLKEQNPDKKLVFFCFRGGTRSSSVVQVMSMIKIDCYKLIGGYKEYRQTLLSKMEDLISQKNFLVLSGNTGSGKTIVLNKLIDKNIPVVDLEECAKHRGSIFGAVALNPTTQKNFEDSLFYSLLKTNNNKIFVESESRNIGDVRLPNSLYDKMKISDHILLEVSIPKRVEILKEIYNPHAISSEKVIKMFESNKYFKTLLGNEWYDQMLDYIKENNYDIFIEKLLVDYYDPLYSKSQKEYEFSSIIKTDDLEEAANILVKKYGVV